MRKLLAVLAAAVLPGSCVSTAPALAGHTPVVCLPAVTPDPACTPAALKAGAAPQVCYTA